MLILELLRDWDLFLKNFNICSLTNEHHGIYPLILVNIAVAFMEKNLAFVQWIVRTFHSIAPGSFFPSYLGAPFFLLSAVLLILIFCAYFEKKSPYYSYGFFAGCISLYIITISYFLCNYDLSIGHDLLNGAVFVDTFSLNFNKLLLGFSFFVVLLSLPYVLRSRVNSYEFFCLVLISCAGMMWLLLSQNLLMLYLCIELQALSFYVMASHKRNSLHSLESGLKYFSLSALASGMLLFGFTLFYYVTGSINLKEISLIVSTISASSDLVDPTIYLYPVALGLLLIIAAFLFKFPAAPFHMWAADVYEGSPTSSTLFFMSLPKIALFSVLSSLLIRSFYPLLVFWKPAILFVAVLSLLIGYLSTLNQLSLKKLFVYSGVTHVGFMLLSLISIDCFHTKNDSFRISSLLFEHSGFSLFFYLIVYSLMICAGLIFIMLNTGSLQSSTNRFSHYGIKDFPSFYNNHGYVFLILGLFFSFIGIPPTIGFFSKFYILKESFLWASSFLLLLVLFFVITSSGFVYGRIISLLFFRNIVLSHPRYWWASVQNSFLWTRGFSFLVLITFLFFLFPRPLLYFSNELALTLSRWDISPGYTLSVDSAWDLYYPPGKSFIHVGRFINRSDYSVFPMAWFKK